MKVASSRRALGQVALSLMLLSGGILVALADLGAVNAATTSTTTNSFPVTINQTSFTGNATIIVSGSDASSSQISVQIYNPRDVSMGIVTVAVRENSTFSATYQASWPAWNVTGVYSVVVTAPIADYVGVIPTSYLSFQYTAVPPATSSTTTATSSTTAPPSGSGVTYQGILPVLIAIVIVVGLMGFIFSSRGQRRPRTTARPSAPAPKPQRP